MVLFIVPGENPLPVAVQVTLVIAIESAPLVRSSAAMTVNVTDAPVAVFAFAVIEIAPSDAGIIGVVSGSALAKVTVDALSASLAAAATVTATLTLPVEVAATTGCAKDAERTMPANEASRIVIVRNRRRDGSDRRRCPD